MKKQIIKIIKQRLQGFFEAHNITDSGFIDLQLPPDKKNGDFSLNAAMRFAKAAHCRPMALANEMAEALRAETNWFLLVEVAAPGFINLFLADKAIEEYANTLFNSEGLIKPVCKDNQKVLIDYSSVNIAKQMHVGHLRSTVIGDVLSRVIEALGFEVIRQNHLGDWGLPMAMVIFKAESEIDKNESEITVARLEELYRAISAECAENEQVKAACHNYLVRLQNGDEKLIKLWQKIVRISMNEVYRIYKLLNVKLTPQNECGESFYRNMLSDTVKEIEKSGKAVEDHGAKCVFLDEFKTKDKKPLPIIIQKSDGGYVYVTFDLAAIIHRTRVLKAKRLIYVTDARQALHFKQVFASSRATGILTDESVKLEHVAFGSILGEDDKPLKTRSGENVKLAELLNEAIERAYQVVNEKNPNLSAQQKSKVAEAIGIGAVKYADLAQNRNNDYVFSFQKMLSLNGNTAPYLQYAHARICSIFRKAKLDINSYKAKIKISAEQERDLLIKNLDFQQVVEAVAKDLRPHVLCLYLYDLASCFSAFYTACPVIGAENENIRASRLAICALTAKTLRTGLDLLGIYALGEM